MLNSYTYVGLYGSGYFNFAAKVPSQSCSCAFSVLISLHFLSFIENVFIILVITRISHSKINYIITFNTYKTECIPQISNIFAVLMESAVFLLD